MRLVALVASVVISSACGGVSEGGDGDGDGDGDAGADARICGAREVQPDCACADGWTDNATAACSAFSDDFNRAAGGLGSTWVPADNPLVEEAVIVNNRACGDIQSVGLLAEAIGSRNLTARFNMDPGNVEGQEASFIFSDTDDLTDLANTFIAGCDGGGGACTMRIGEVNQNPLAENPNPITLNAGMNNPFELVIDGSANITLTVAGVQLSANLPAGYTVERLGFIVGRQPDGTLSCVDDFNVDVE